MAGRVPNLRATVADHEAFSALAWIVWLGCVRRQSLARDLSPQTQALDSPAVDRVGQALVAEIGHLRDRVVQILGIESEAARPLFAAQAWWADGSNTDIDLWLVSLSNVTEPLPVDLSHPDVVQRMVDAASDSQAVVLLQALIGAHSARHPPSDFPAGEVLDLFGELSDLFGLRLDGDVVFRMWRLKWLLPMLLPDRGVDPGFQADLRLVARTFDRAVEG
jgi:hypothetical protein